MTKATTTAAESGGCSPCNMFGTFLNFFMMGGGKPMGVLVFLCVLFLLLSFIFG